MNFTCLVLLLYIGRIIVLFLAIAAHRTWLTLTANRAANSFSPDGLDVSDAGQRLVRAHANCLESFPIFGGLMFLAIVTIHTHLLNGTVAFWFVARLGQSITHLLSTSPTAVMVRFTFFCIQVGLACWWLIQLVLVLK